MVFLLTIIRVALKALGLNKMRSILTMLGIIIGVGAVIAMVSIGQGAQATIAQQIASAGSNMLYVSAGSYNRCRWSSRCRWNRCPVVAATSAGSGWWWSSY